MLEQLNDGVTPVAGEHALFVVALFDKIIETLLDALKSHGVRANVGGKKGVHRIMVFAKLYVPLTIVEVKHRV